MTTQELEKVSRELRLKIVSWNANAWESFGYDHIDNVETGKAALAQGRELRLRVTEAMLDAVEGLEDRLRATIESDFGNGEAIKESFQLINAILSLDSNRTLIAQNEGMIYGMSFHRDERPSLTPYQVAEKQLDLFDTAAAPGWVG
ncbi:MAG: hypothetical protein MOB07_30505 [Acidobacteria bacterium]|nr:hypothetical protein [Acidobacteriota bacterium]